MSLRPIDLADGMPAENVLPYDLIECGAQSFFSSSRWNNSKLDLSTTSSPLNYGDMPVFYTETLAGFLSAHSSGRTKVNPKLIVPTTGVSQGLDLVCTMLTNGMVDRSRYFVFVEDVSYFLAAGMFKNHGLGVRSVATDKYGIVVDDLKRQLDALDGEKEIPLFVYTVPMFHNPTGRTMIPARRDALLELTKEKNILVVADEVYQLLDYTAHLPADNANATPSAEYALPAPSLSAHDGKYNHVLTCGSFSKILAPGLRCGWIECSTAEQVAAFWSLGIMQSSSTMCHFSSHIVATLLQNDGLADAAPTSVMSRHLTTLCTSFAHKYHVLSTALVKYSNTHLSHTTDGDAPPLSLDGYGEGTRVGGYFIWVGLPRWLIECEKCSDFAKSTATSGFRLATKTILIDKAQTNYNLTLRSGYDTCTLTSVDEKKVVGGRYIRFCFARQSDEDLTDGAERFCLLLADMYKLHRNDH